MKNGDLMINAENRVGGSFRSSPLTEPYVRVRIRLFRLILAEMTSTHLLTVIVADSAYGSLTPYSKRSVCKNKPLLNFSFQKFN